MLFTIVDLYGQPSIPYGTVPSFYGSPSTSGIAPPTGSTPHTLAEGTSHITPSHLSHNLYRVQTIAAVVLILLVVGLISSKLLPLAANGGGNVAPPSTSPAKAFVDTFTDNHNQWMEGNFDGVTAGISNSQYSLTVDNQQNTHFPYPAAIGILPENFTMTVHIMQNAGKDDVAYGLAFHLTYEGSQAKSCYAFVITSSGSYAVLRYTGGVLDNAWSSSWTGGSSAMHTGSALPNELQAIVQGNTFSFKINGQTVTTKSGTTVTDTAYTGGQLGVLVAGPSASFTVTQVQLAIP